MSDKKASLTAEQKEACMQFYKKFCMHPSYVENKCQGELDNIVFIFDCRSPEIKKIKDLIQNMHVQDGPPTITNIASGRASIGMPRAYVDYIKEAYQQPGVIKEIILEALKTLGEVKQYPEQKPGQTYFVCKNEADFQKAKEFIEKLYPHGITRETILPEGKVARIARQPLTLEITGGLLALLQRPEASASAGAPAPSATSAPKPRP